MNQSFVPDGCPAEQYSFPDKQFNCQMLCRAVHLNLSLSIYYEYDTTKYRKTCAVCSLARGYSTSSLSSSGCRDDGKAEDFGRMFPDRVAARDMTPETNRIVSRIRYRSASGRNGTAVQPLARWVRSISWKSRNGPEDFVSCLP